MTTSGDTDAQRYVRMSDIDKKPQKMLMPIRGFEKMPLVTLEEAVIPLISILPEIQDYAYVAKQRCESVPADDLTRDQSASIILYSMDWEPHRECLYFVLNETLRAEDRRKLKPWFSYLKLILTGLAQIPSTRNLVYRGVKMDLSKQYTEGQTFIWWGFSSCTSNLKVLENEEFFGKKGERTMFTIDCESGKDISRHSYYQSEEEILLLAARQFVVKAYIQPTPGLHMIQLKETQSPICLLQLVTSDATQDKSKTNSAPEEKAVTADAASIAPKVDIKGGANYSTKETPVKMNESAKLNTKSEYQKLAEPNDYPELNCKGRPCRNCGKCRDWYFNGDVKTWQWIQNWMYWSEGDHRRYNNDQLWNQFIRRDNSTCTNSCLYGADRAPPYDPSRIPPPPRIYYNSVPPDPKDPAYGCIVRHDNPCHDIYYLGRSHYIPLICLCDDNNSNESSSNIQAKQQPETSAVSIQPKSGHGTYTEFFTNKKPTTMYKMETPKPIIEVPEFAAPGQWNELYCRGRLCYHCGRCRDWYYIGDLVTWRWIKDRQCHWKKDDWQRYRNDRVYDRFKRRTDGATCGDTFSSGDCAHVALAGFGLSSYPYHNPDLCNCASLYSHAGLAFLTYTCLCDDNCR